VVRAYNALAVGDVPGTVKHAQRVFELLPEGDHLRREQATALMGMTYWASGDLEAADRVFADGEALQALNAIVHPAVGTEIARRLENASTGDGVVILDVPLLVESGRDDLAGLIVVDLDPEVAISRLVEQRGFSEADARARIARQVSRDDRLARADFVIHNHGNRAELAEQIEACWGWIRTLS